MDSSLSGSSDLSNGGDAEGVWSQDIDQAFHEALQIYPPCGRRKIILSDEGKMYGRNELIARYIKIRCGKTRTRKQVSSHIQVLSRKRNRESQTKLKLANGSSETIPYSPSTSLSPSHLISASESNLQSLNPLFPKCNKNDQSSLKSQEFNIGLKNENSNLQLNLIPSTQIAALQWTNLTNNILYCNKNFTNMDVKLVNNDINTFNVLNNCIVLSTSKIVLCEFSAYVEQSNAGYKNRIELITLPKISDEFEMIKFDDIKAKYPSEFEDFFNRGPSDAFFLVKSWANVSFDINDDNSSVLYAVDSFFRSLNPYEITVSTKVCSFSHQVVEKVEIYSPAIKNEINGSNFYDFCLEKSPMCDYMVRFIKELKKLGNNLELMNSVLDNFTIIMIVSDKSNGDILLSLAFMFEISPDSETTSSRIYRLY